MELKEALNKILKVKEPWYTTETEFHEKEKIVRALVSGKNFERQKNPSK